MSDSYIKQRDEKAAKFTDKNGFNFRPDGQKILDDTFKAGADWARRHTLMSDEVDGLYAMLSAVRSQLCWETDRDQATDGMRDLHTGITKALANFDKLMKEME